MARILFAVLLSVSCTIMVHAQTRKTGFPSVREESCGTPEAAVSGLVEGLKNGDLERIFSVCAVNEIAERYDFGKFSARLGAINPLIWKAPSTSELYVTVNRIDVMFSLARQIKILTYSLLTGMRLDGMTISPIDDKMADEFIAAADPSRLKGITLVRTDFPNSKLASNERYLRNAKESALPFGADDSTERVVLISFGKNHYCFGVHLLRYGTSWKIDSLCSPLANTSATGSAERTSPERYAKDVSGD